MTDASTDNDIDNDDIDIDETDWLIASNKDRRHGRLQ